MRNRTVAMGIVCLFLLSSCATLYEFPVEVFQPPKVDLPASVKTIALVSRNLKYSTDTQQNYYTRDNKLIKDQKPLNIDSITVKACLDSLSANIEKEPRFSKVILLPLTTFPRQTIQNSIPPIDTQEQKIVSDTQADVIILLDMFSAFYSINHVFNSYQYVAKVVTASIWTVYNPATNRVIRRTSLIDTLYWDGMDEKGDYQISRIPAKKDALAIAAGMVGAKYSKNLVPSWNQVNRQILCVEQIDFLQALGMAKTNDWDQASVFWEKYTASKNNRFRLQSLYNLAVAREMDGDIEGAQELLSRALANAPASTCGTEKKTIRNYSLILTKRKMELERIRTLGYEE